MDDFSKEQRRLNMIYDTIGFVGIAFGSLVIICKLILIAVR